MWTTAVSTTHSWWSVGTHCPDCMVLQQWNHITMNRPSISSRCVFCKPPNFLLLPFSFWSWIIFLITYFLRKTCADEQNWEGKTVNMFQQEECNIFGDLSSEEYKEVLNFIQRDILATDLASYFPCQKMVRKLFLSNSLDFTNNDHL